MWLSLGNECLVLDLDLWYNIVICFRIIIIIFSFEGLQLISVESVLVLSFGGLLCLFCMWYIVYQIIENILNYEVEFFVLIQSFEYLNINYIFVDFSMCIMKIEQLSNLNFKKV